MRKNIHCKYLTTLGTVLAVLLGLFIFSDSYALPYTLSLTSSGSQSIDISASAGTAINSDAINVATTCRYGYNFTINTSVSDNNLYLGGNSSNNTEGTYFSPTDGTTALNATTNKWGYYYNATTAPTNTSVFSPVPTLSSPATVITPLTTPSSSDINDNFNIYYGVSSAPTMAKGTYKMIPDTNNSNNDGTIVYTATIADACTQYTVHFSPTSQFEGNTLSGTGTMNDQSIYEGVATALTSNGFTAPSGYYFAGWNTAQDGSGTRYTNGQQVTDLTTAGSSITLYAMWTDCPPNTICYSPNVSNPNDVEGEMGNQTITSSAISADLYAPNFKRDNYGFVAWNTKKDGTGTNYGPQATIEFTAGVYSTGGFKLYAKWIASAGNMQNWSGCSSMNIGDVTARKDTRDNNVYAIAKLADGKCWMIENLRLADKDSNNNDTNLSSSNTHNPSLPLTNSDSTTSNHLSPTTDPTSTAWCQDSNSACIDQSMLATNNTTLFTSNTASSYDASSNVYSYGNYYNFYSATGGHGNYDKTGGNVAGDICPVGWRLPIGKNASGDFGLLDKALGGTGSSSSATTNPDGATMVRRWLSFPNNFIYSGYVLSSSVHHRNSSGNYKSSSVGWQNGAYHLYISNNNVVQPGDSAYSFYYGESIRCISNM